MIIPDHLNHNLMNPEQKNSIENFVKASRDAMKESPAFNSVDEATREAVNMSKKENYSFPSVWREPRDVGNKHTVVHVRLREKAGNAGYTEEVNEQKIFDLAHKNVDEIEEV